MKAASTSSYQESQDAFHDEGLTERNKGFSLLCNIHRHPDASLALVIFPILGTVMILIVMSLLHVRVVKDMPINEMSVSLAMSIYEPYWQVLLPLTVGSVIFFAVSIVRSIQTSMNIQQIQPHDNTIASKNGLVAMRITNAVATVASVLAFVSYILLAFWRHKPGGTERENIQHHYGSYGYFILVGVYILLHTISLYQQKNSNYPMALKHWFGALALTSIVSSVVYERSGLKLGACEWIALAMNAFYFGSYSLLFYLEPMLSGDVGKYLSSRHQSQVSVQENAV